MTTPLLTREQAKAIRESVRQIRSIAMELENKATATRFVEASPTPAEIDNQIVTKIHEAPYEPTGLYTVPLITVFFGAAAKPSRPMEVLMNNFGPNKHFVTGPEGFDRDAFCSTLVNAVKDKYAPYFPDMDFICAKYKDARVIEVTLQLDNE